MFLVYITCRIEIKFFFYFSATYIFNHDNSRFLGMHLFIFICHIRLFCNRHGKQTLIRIAIMGDIWWVIIICSSVNVFSLMGGGTEADVGFPTCSGDTQPYTYGEY